MVIHQVAAEILKQVANLVKLVLNLSGHQRVYQQGISSLNVTLVVKTLDKTFFAHCLNRITHLDELVFRVEDTLDPHATCHILDIGLLLVEEMTLGVGVVVRNQVGRLDVNLTVLHGQPRTAVANRLNINLGVVVQRPEIILNHRDIILREFGVNDVAILLDIFTGYECLGRRYTAYHAVIHDELLKRLVIQGLPFRHTRTVSLARTIRALLGINQINELKDVLQNQIVRHLVVAYV